MLCSASLRGAGLRGGRDQGKNPPPPEAKQHNLHENENPALFPGSKFACYGIYCDKSPTGSLGRRLMAAMVSQPRSESSFVQNCCLQGCLLAGK